MRPVQSIESLCQESRRHRLMEWLSWSAIIVLGVACSVGAVAGSVIQDRALLRTPALAAAADHGHRDARATQAAAVGLAAPAQAGEVEQPGLAPAPPFVLLTGPKPAANEKLIAAGCTWACVFPHYNGGSERPKPEDYLDDALEYWKAHPGQVKAINLTGWFGNRSLRIEGPADGVPLASWDAIVAGYRRGEFDMTPDVKHSSGLGAKFAEHGIVPAFCLVDFENALSPWGDWRIHGAIIGRLFADPKIVAKMPASLREPGAGDRLRAGWQATGADKFDPLQRDFLAFSQGLYAKSIRKGLLAAGLIGPKTYVVYPFIGRFPQDETGEGVIRSDMKWRSGSSVLSPYVCSNDQWYNGSVEASLAFVRMSKATRFVPTLRTDCPPEAFLTRCLRSPLAIELYPGDGFGTEAAHRLTSIIKAYVAGELN